MSDDIPLIKRELLTRMDGLLASLFPHKRIIHRKREWRIGAQGSLSVRADGCWYSHEAGAGGDVMDLISYALSLDFKAALAFAKSFIGGVVSPRYAPALPADDATDANRIQQQVRARCVWRQCKPIGGADAAR